jgi:putative mycofactocin binding protein MftB
MTNGGISLHRTCRVRKERFGLLFYDSRGPKLLFAATGDLLSPELFTGDAPVAEILNQLSEDDGRKVTTFLTHLKNKGFIREQQIC